MNFYKNKRILVTGCSGLIGKQLTTLLSKEGAIVYPADLKIGQDLRSFSLCKSLCKEMDYIFHLMGIKGSPRMTEQKPADFFVPMIQCNTNMLEAARLAEVKKFLYTSSIAVENMESDFYPAWAKLTGEHQIAAYRKQYPEDCDYTIVRPANVYGPYDNFNNPDAMVITSLIKKAFTDEFIVWGDGTPIRDFIFSRDVAKAMMLVMEKNPQEPVNIGSGKGCTIETVAKKIHALAGCEATLTWDKNKPMGAKRRVMNIRLLRALGFKPQVTLHEGLKETVEWYKGWYKKSAK